MERNRCYRKGELVAEDFDPAAISDRLADGDCVVWLDLESPGEAELALLAQEFGLNALAVEDASHEHQRPKVDRYDTHVFISVYGVRFDAATGELATSELAVFASPRWLITVRKSGGFDMGQVVARWDGTAQLAGAGVGWLLHGLLDTVVDGHFAAVDALDDSVEAIEERLFIDTPEPVAVQRRTFEIRKTLVGFRRLTLPMREVLNTLLRRDLGFATGEMGPYYQDVYDHVLRVTEWTESLRDLVTTIQDSNLQVQSNRLNEVMRSLTAYAAIFGAVAAVTGFFGQNLPYPGFGHTSGLVAMGVLLFLSVVGLGALFRRRGWL